MRYLIAVGVLTVAAIILIFVFEPQRADYRAERAREKRLKQEVLTLRAENERLKSEIYRMKTDPFYLEKYARETFGLAASNEIIYKFDD